MNGLTFKFSDNGEEYKVMDILAPSNSKYQYIIYTNGEEIFASRYSVSKDKKVTLSDGSVVRMSAREKRTLNKSEK